MRVGDEVQRCPVDEELLEAPDEAVAEGAGPEGGREAEVGVHVVHAANEQVVAEVKLGGVAWMERIRCFLYTR